MSCRHLRDADGKSKRKFAFDGLMASRSGIMRWLMFMFTSVQIIQSHLSKTLLTLAARSDGSFLVNRTVRNFISKEFHLPRAVEMLSTSSLKRRPFVTLRTVNFYANFCFILTYEKSTWPVGKLR